MTGSLIPHFDGTGAVIGYIASIEDVTDRHRALDTLLRREKFVTSLLDAAVDGILTIDARGMIQSVNRSCCQMFGFDEIELVGAPLAMLMPTPHQHRHAAYVDNYMSSGRAKIIGTRAGGAGQAQGRLRFPDPPERRGNALRRRGVLHRYREGRVGPPRGGRACPLPDQSRPAYRTADPPRLPGALRPRDGGQAAVAGT